MGMGKTGGNRASRLAIKRKQDHQIQVLVDRYGGHDGKIDMDELRSILTELDGRPPLPKDLLWAMSNGDKDGSGQMGHGELKLVLRKYAKYKSDADDILDLIKKYDKNHDCKLDDVELRELMKAAVGVESIGDDDVQAVRELLQKYSKKQSKVDPDALAKAISVWDDEKDLSESIFAKGISLDSISNGMPDFKIDPSKAWESTGKMMQETYQKLACCCAPMRCEWE